MEVELDGCGGKKTVDNGQMVRQCL